MTLPTTLPPARSPAPQGASADAPTPDVRQEESAVHASLLLEVAANVDAIVWSSGLDGRFIYLNSAVERLTGFPPRAFLDDPGAWWDRVHPEDLEHVRKRFASAFGNNTFTERYRFLTSGGEYRHFKVIGRLQRAADGTPLRVVGVTVDVTAHDRRNGDLRSALDEARAYRNLFANANALSAMMDFKGYLTLVSPAWRSAMGYDPRNLVGRPLLAIAHPDDVARAREVFEGLVRDGAEVSSLELRFRCYDGSYRWLLWNLAADADAQRLYGVAQDVSERKLAELVIEETTAALQDRERMLSQTQRLAQLGGWQWDVVNDVVTWSEECSRIVGLEPGTPLPPFDGLGALFTPDSWAQLRRCVATALEFGTSYELELEVVRADGSHRWTIARGEADVGGDGRVTRLRGTWQDITDRKNAELALRASEQRLRDMTAEIPDVIYQFRMRPDGAIEFPFMSEGLRRLFEIDPEEVYADPAVIWRLIEPSMLDVFQASIRHSAETMRPWVHNFDVVLRSGERRRVHGASRPQREADGGILWSGLLRDVTEQRAQEEELVRTREAALAASREKSFFLANMSHEIRTPMNGILGMTELALDTPLSEEQREYLEAVRQSGDSLLSILNDILDLSKIEARHVTIEHVPFLLRRVVDEAVGLLLPRAHARGLAVSVDVDPGLPQRVAGDPLRLGQVLRNFVSNAVKFTETGSISVRVTAGDDAGLVRFAITDTGIGIAPDDQARIFEPFAQSDSATTRRYGGTGLGLSIARQLAGLMGGRVAVESTPGAGSTFHFAIPLPAASDDVTTVSSIASLAGAPEARPAAPLGLRVLVVEDNVINARVVARMLQKLGCEVEGADTGLAALDAAARGSFDVVLMDIQMPDLDGYETTRRIRLREQETGSHVQIVALTANAMKGDEQRCLDAGMDGYLAKPIAIEGLKAELQRVSRASGA
jgi:PAS domain S-box-containing protein